MPPPLLFRLSIALATGLSLSAGLAAQATAAVPQSPHFEVASIKESAPITPATTQVSAGIHVDGAQVHCSLLSVRDYIRTAYRLEDYQIVGAPDWTASTRYDVDAVLPPGATRDQVPEMLKALLAERFGLRVHSATVTLPVYMIVVDKGGVKMKALPPNPEGNLDIHKSLANVNATGNAGGTTVNFGNGSTISLDYAAGSITGMQVTIDNLANLLGRFEDRPVLDHTGLTGIYDIKLKLDPQDMQVLLIRAAQKQGVALPPQALALLDGASEGSLHAALGQLGLRMEEAKAPVETTVVDHVGKPGANQ